MRIFRWLFSSLLMMLLPVFAVFNRHMVEFTWHPLKPEIHIPLYLIALGFMGTGFFFGMIVFWLGESPRRRERRRQMKELKAMEKQLDTLKKRQSDDAPPSDFFPSLPKKG